MPPALTLLVVLGVITLSMVLVVWISRWVQAERALRRGNLEAARARFDGVLQQSFWRGDSVEFEAEGVPARLTYFGGSDKAPPWTKVHFDWAPADRRMRVTPEGMWASLKKVFGAQDVQIGEPAFDAAFLIQGQPEAWVREVLGPQARAQLEAVQALGISFGRGKAVSLDVTPAGVVLQVPRNLVRVRSDLLAFLEGALAILGELRRDAGSGARVSVKALVAQGHCPVCGETPEGRPKRCGTCAAEYHLECWSYLGGCAIFGCGESYQPKPRQRQKEW